MQKILANIIHGFLLNKLIDEKESLDLINDVLLKNNEKKISTLSFPKKRTFEIKEHLNYINDLRKYFRKKYNSEVEIENKINETLGAFIPSQNEINHKFNDSHKYSNLLKISLISYYVKLDKNELNISWNHSSKYGNFRISINMAKPEKTQAQIIAEKNLISKENSNDPKCPICVENINFKGSLVKDSRENLRVIFVDLLEDGRKNWFFQYSPYSYINKHFVLNSLEHEPMIIDNNTVRNLIYFIDKNSNFFIGSNADLPIIGGSLLGHNHYQGGQDDLPIMNAKSLEKIFFKGVEINILAWPLNAIKISSKDKEEIIKISNFFINSWKVNTDYNLKSNNNSTTIITRKTHEIFDTYLIFRNNSISDEKPFGNFHINHSKFNIKQENIGLMEAAGLAILPKRLVVELHEIIEMYNNEYRNPAIKEDFVKLILKNDKLSKHALWIKNILENNIEINKENLTQEISNVFVSCLEDCKVLSDYNFIEFIKEKTKYNQEVYAIKNEIGLFIEIINKGFTIKQIKLSDKSFLLEYENIDSYFSNNDIFLNSFVGPVAGRIEKGFVKLEKSDINLSTDDMNNYIHGMNEKWSDLIFDIQMTSHDQFDLVTGIAKQDNIELDSHFLIIIKLKIWRYKNKIDLEYIVESNKETICNPTQHYYWTIPNTKSIFDVNIDLKSKDYWVLNENFNPLKKKEWKSEEKLKISQIRDVIGENQVKLVNNGIDHPFELIEDTSIILSSPDSKYTLTSCSTINKIVLYTHNWKSSNPLLGTKNNIHEALCIEYQEVPTSFNNPNFDKITISKNKPYINNVTYEFKVKA